MEGRHLLSISLLDTMFQKTISNRPRYQAEGAKPEMAKSSMRQFADRNITTQSRAKRF